MKIRNKSGRLIVLNYKKGAGWAMVLLPANSEITEPNLKQSDIAHFVEEGSIEVVKEKKEAEVKTTPAQDIPYLKDDGEVAISLPAEPTAELLKETFTLQELKLYCRQNRITKYSKLDEDAITALILASLETEK